MLNISYSKRKRVKQSDSQKFQ